jgi:hypothetical protein
MSSNLIIGVAERQSSPDNDVFQTTGTECTMTKYCIALVSPQRSESHVRVGEFPAAERAFQLAELIAFDLGIEADGKWWGWTVEVRSAQGRKLFAVPVASADVHQPPEAVSGSPAMTMGSSRH